MRSLIREIRSAGAEELLAGGTTPPPRAAVFYSIPSLVLSFLTGKDGMFTPSAYTADFFAWLLAMRESGFGAPEIVTEETMDDLNRYEILVLPAAQCISGRAWEKIEQFAGNGGILLADARPGAFNEFAVPRSPDRIGKLFGVRSVMKNGRGNSLSVRMDGRNLPFAPSNDFSETTSAKALGEIGRMDSGIHFGGIRSPAKWKPSAPFAAVHSFGKGKTILLGALATPYDDERNHSGGLVFLTALRKILASAGTENTHAPAPGCHVGEFVRDGIRSFCLVQSPCEKPEESRLNFGQSLFLYDTLNHRPLGRTDHASVRLEPYEVRMIAALPERSPDVHFHLKRDGGIFRISVRPDSNGPVLLRFSIARNGVGMDRLSQNGLFRGPGDFTLDAGLEPKPGTWTVQVLNIFTGTNWKAEETIP